MNRNRGGRPGGGAWQREGRAASSPIKSTLSSAGGPGRRRPGRRDTVGRAGDHGGPGQRPSVGASRSSSGLGWRRRRPRSTRSGLQPWLRCWRWRARVWERSARRVTAAPATAGRPWSPPGPCWVRSRRANNGQPRASAVSRRPQKPQITRPNLGFSRARLGRLMTAGVGPSRRPREPVSELFQVVWLVGQLGRRITGTRGNWDASRCPAPARQRRGLTVDAQQRNGSARSRANARASAAAHGQVACRRRIVRRAWRTMRAARCSSR
jgi:hypothetical protein